MLYSVYLHVGDADHAHGVTFPDFPGCIYTVDDWSDLPAAVQDAVEAHFSGKPDAVPPPTPHEELVGIADYEGGVWMLVDLDLSRIDSQPVRLNVTPPSHLVQQIDALAKAHHIT